MQKTCVVIPCYNEGKRLPATTFTRFLEQNSYSIYFVNDGSKDNTLQIILNIKDQYPKQVEIIDLPKNLGKGEAVRQGFLAAFRNEKFQYIGYFDADLATPLEEVDFLLSHLIEETEVVIGSRVKKLGSKIIRYPIRHYLGRVFATMASVTLNIEVYDSQCGAKIFRKEIAKLLFFNPFISKWLFDLELIYRLKNMYSERFNRIIIEVPLRTWEEKGKTKIKFLDFLNVPFELWRIKKQTLKKPLLKVNPNY